MLTVNTNVASLNAQNNLIRSQNELSVSLARLSSGLRINSAKDDAAGLAISNRMSAQIRGLNQAARNANDGISLAQVAEGAMGEITNMLLRMRELAIESANGTFSDEDRESLQAEYDHLMTEISRIADSTRFNDQLVLDGSLATVRFQVGTEATDFIDVDIDADMSADGDLAISGTDISTASNAVAALDPLDGALSEVDGFRGDLGAIQARFESTIANTMNISENVSAARSRILDADFALETANLTRAQILQQAGIAMLAQANLIPQSALVLLQ